MSDLPDSVTESKDYSTEKFELPVSNIVRAVCSAANRGPETLYEVMLKLSLVVEAAVPTYGLSIWTLRLGERPRLKWNEGLNQAEVQRAEEFVAGSLTRGPSAQDIAEGDDRICIVLAVPTGDREGAAIFGRCVRPLTGEQARDLRAIVDVTKLAHTVVASGLPLTSQNELEAGSPVVGSALPGMVFSSKSMAALAQAVERIKDSDSTVLVTGESGTGKELIASAIHRLSRRAEGNFIPFNCSAVPAELMESMLFGHRKGTFTGAHADYEGLIRSAENGTLFLDEIGDLPLALQPKLLRFLQEAEVHTLGERIPRKVNVRVIAATHKDLEELVREKAFREDLYYRIATLNVIVPPLRERPEDIGVLISHFLTYYARRNKRNIGGITGEAIRILHQYSWPGNVRELAGEMERLVLYAEDNGYICPEDISPRILPPKWQSQSPRGRNSGSLDVMLEDYERRVITETLKQHDCNVARTSAALGLGSRQTLYKKLKRLAIDIGDFLQEDTEPGLQLRAERR
jgi:transcriptional regulator with GAF, ATPase, and Fis domain